MTPTLATGQIQIIPVAATPALREYARALADRAAAVRSGHVHPADDNLLKITADGRKASVFNGPPNTWPAPPYRTKLEACADRVWQHYAESDDHHGAQLVFCDLYTPKTADAAAEDYYNPKLIEAELFEELGVYGRFKTALASKGVPPDEVAFAHDYRTPRTRAKLHEAIRRGAVRVCVGSTPLIGQAVNVQDRLIALHNLDCPWRPDELEQRTRRGIRQGNRFDQVHVYVYVTEGSYDPVVWQIVEGKARWLNQLMSGTAARREAEDIGAVVLTASLAKAVALGDSRVLEKTRLEVELAGLERRWLSWSQSRTALRRDTARLPSQIAALRAESSRLRTWATHVTVSGGEALGLSLVSGPGVEPATVATLQDGNAIVRDLWQRHAAAMRRVWVGSWRGFWLWLEPRDGALALAAYPTGSEPDGLGLCVRGVGFHSVRPIDALGQMLDVETLERDARAVDVRVRNLEARLAAAVFELGASWPMQDEADRLLAAYSTICAGRAATEDAKEVAELSDRVTFRFR